MNPDALEYEAPVQTAMRGDPMSGSVCWKLSAFNMDSHSWAREVPTKMTFPLISGAHKNVK
jgi:hypothetical protein